MNRYYSSLALGIMVAGAVWAGDEREARAKVLADAEVRLKSIYDNRDFTAKTFPGKWLANSSGYVVLETPKGSSEPELVRYELEGGKRIVVIGSDQLAVPGTAGRLTVQQFFQTPVPNTFLLQGHIPGDKPGKTSSCLYDSKSKVLKNIAADIPLQSLENAFSPSGDRILYRRGANLAVVHIEDGRTIALTTDESREARSNGEHAKWSPDGTKIAYVQSDHSKLRLRPVIHPGDPSYPAVSFERFARIGTPIPSLRVGVVGREGGETRWIKLPDDPGTFYINNVSWAGNSGEVQIEILSRFRDSRRFMIANIETGTVATAYEESDPAWVDASNGTNAGLEWIDNGKSFVLLSERGGWRQAYRLSRDGKEQTLITKDKCDITARGPVEEAGGWFYYMASPKNATQRYLYRTRLDGNTEPERVTPADKPGTHSYDFSPDRKWAFHTYSTFDSPPVVDLVRLDGHHSERVLEANEDVRKRAEPFITAPTEFLKLDIGNGVEMDAWMIKPRKFDAAKKYPVLVFIYGEPHGQTVLDDWAGGQNHSMFHRMIADLGYLVVSIDNRGTPAPKGAAWRRSVFGCLGTLSTEEQAAGLKELGRRKSFVDLSRVGIWGWSGGGSNTLNAMFRKPDVYHVGIAVAPKPRPELYNAWFQEIFMRTPEINPEGYKKSAAINYAEGLRGDLLIVHGTGETNTHLQITESLVDRLIELGKRFDYMAYPNRDHGLKEGKGTAVHLRMLMTRYLIEHLSAGPR